MADRDPVLTDSRGRHFFLKTGTIPYSTVSDPQGGVLTLTDPRGGHCFKTGQRGPCPNRPTTQAFFENWHYPVLMTLPDPLDGVLTLTDQ